jgi:hypothetical protein|tara:strand:- start:1250 stop:1435 length:186 start_codon:yes stop_codon:yes gene_type:complete
MTRYQVHYESTMTHGPDTGKIIHMISLPIEAKSEREAIAKCKAARAGSFGHWVNRLANEAA